MVIIVMGVSGSGKSTIGWQLAHQLGWRFEDADDWHSSQSIAKMRQNIPLTDLDRAPWLNQLQRAIDDWRQTGEDVVLACSALKQNYRDQLRCQEDGVKLVYLRGTHQQIRQRMAQRHGHFMPEALLTSQFESLEEPQVAITVDIHQDSSDIVQQIVQALNVSA
ncbi:MAG: gluconokinase [Elainellaceae cyanobacterium]